MSDREIVFRALVGSWNYNLQTESSDKDYKVFTLPTFEDLYYGREQSKSIIGETEDQDFHDIRKLLSLFWKANLNFIEVLYSKDLDCDFENYHEVESLIKLRDKIVTMNLPYLFGSCKGMFYEKMKKLEHGTSGTMHLVDKYGFDTKQAMHAYRILDFGIKFAEGDFADFASAMCYYDYEREYMLMIKGGKYSLSEFKVVAESKFKHFMKFEPKYLRCLPDELTKYQIDQLVASLVKRSLT